MRTGTPQFYSAASSDHRNPDKPWRHIQAPTLMEHFQPDLLPAVDAPCILRCSACGREFLQSSSFSIHVGSCRSSKKRMSTALEFAKESYLRKKARLNRGPVIELEAPQQPPIDVPQAPVQVSGALLGADIAEIEVSILTQILL